MEGSNPIGPAVITALSGNSCLAVYGFSGKPAYDRFIANSNRELKPYPLVKGYLQHQAAAGDRELRLVILDADHAGEQTLRAASMNSIFTALSANTDQIDSEYQLSFDSESCDYRLAESSA
jgi:hypothetical protein